MLLNKLTKNLKIRQLRCIATSSQTFPVLPDKKELLEVELTGAKNRAEELLAELKKINAICAAGGGEKGRLLHVEKNRKVLPRERVQALFDNGEFLELSLQAGLGMYYGDIPGGSIIAAVGKVNDRFCITTANDATLKGGTYFPISGQKARRSQNIGCQSFLPHIYIVDSGGGFLPLQSEIFPDKNHGGRGFYSEAVYSAENMPQLAVVCGSSTAGGAYVPVMCDEAVIVDRVGTIFLGGPPLVKAATGEVVTSEELGGATLHCTKSGCTDYFAKTEEEGFQIIRELCDTLDIEPQSRFPNYGESPLYKAEDLNDISGIMHYNADGLLLIISRLVDGSRFRQFKERYGENLICGYGHIDGSRVGILANCGPLTCKDALKGSQFIQSCEMRRIPMVFLQNSGPEEKHKEFYSNISEAELGITLKNRGSMISALSVATVDRIAINIGHCLQDDLYTMCGPSFKPNFNFCWPGTQCQYMPMNDSTDHMLLQEPENRSKMKFPKSVVNFSQNDALYWAAHCLNDGIIVPADTRKVLVCCMNIFDQKRRLKTTEPKHPLLKF